MSGVHSPAIAPLRESPRDWKWTPAEKAATRRALTLGGPHLLPKRITPAIMEIPRATNA